MKNLSFGNVWSRAVSMSKIKNMNKCDGGNVTTNQTACNLDFGDYILTVHARASSVLASTLN